MLLFFLLQLIHIGRYLVGIQIDASFKSLLSQPLPRQLLSSTGHFSTQKAASISARLSTT